MWTIILCIAGIFIGLVLLKLIGQLLAEYVIIPIILVVAIFVLGWISSGFWSAVGWAFLLGVILLVLIALGSDEDYEPSNGSGSRRSSQSRTTRSSIQDNSGDSEAVKTRNNKLRELGYRIDDADREVRSREREIRDAESDLRSAESSLDGHRSTCYPDDSTQSNIREA